MLVIKRDGRKMPYQKERVVTAISKAGLVPNDVKEKIASEIENINKKEISVEEIQDLVEKKLMASSFKDVAKEYVRYRYRRELVRQSSLNNSVLEIIQMKNHYINSENSNKNPKILSTQRDYMAGEVSKEIAKKLIFPEELINMHEQGIIHIHDLDYVSQKMYNCFSSKTRFVTNKGVISFADCNDGQKVTVLDKDGFWREATVRMYGKNSMQDVVFEEITTKEIITIKCTSNHRWILKDNTVTTSIKVNDELYTFNNVQKLENVDDVKTWKVISINFDTDNTYDSWCVEEPITQSFTLDGGVVTGNCALINLDDILQNGTCINGTMIEKPHSFSTACNVATQVMAIIASNQFGK